MNKRHLIDGIACIVIAGIAFLLTFHPAILTPGRLTSLAVIYMILGLKAVIRYFYYNSPRYRDFYHEKLEYEAIEENDERRIRLCEKTGWYTYQFGQELLVVMIIVCAILDSFGLLENADTFTLVLAGYMILQGIAEQVIFRYLSKKY
ncbi:MAG: hypothetical protein J6N32_00235 [Clostridia bacterium]|nr:hypothetical protein [Clostridia bacterium]